MRSRSDKVVLAVDEEERDLIQSIEKDEWTEVPDVERFKAQARRYAEATIRKNRRMNIRISERDLRNLKKRALEDGIPYQTMVSMILHKYLSGRFSEQKPEES
ncbi:MAG: antitoxin [Acidobacteria bacterium]|nr:antitoxin [Spirochaetota bacterium]MBE3129604.1 antitoxin [Acidobacteriota bacterium]